MEPTKQPSLSELSTEKQSLTPGLDEPADSLPSPATTSTPRQGAILGRVPSPGWTYNPLKGLERNSLCPCQSGKKFKKCHLNLLPELVPLEVAEKYRRVLKTTKVIRFVNHDNEPDIPNREPEASEDQQ